jgi:hypothetical protein
VNTTYLTDATKEKVEKLLIKEKVILLGFNAAILEKRATDKWQLPLDILATPDKVDELTDKFVGIFGKDLKIDKVEQYGEIIPPHTDIDDKESGNTLIRIYETQACHSYHKAASGLFIASIPTILQFFFAILYAPKEYLDEIPEQRFLCTAQRLVEMANDNLPRRYKLLTPITCLGTQKSLIDMKAEKSALYQKLSENKKSPEFLEYFFTYMPTSMNKTQRAIVHNRLRRTFRRRRQNP